MKKNLLGGLEIHTLESLNAAGAERSRIPTMPSRCLKSASAPAANKQWSHLAIALGYAACLHGHRVLFANAVDIINTLSAAQAHNRLKAELKKYLSPQLLVIDELGYLPIDQNGADLLFQVISQRYEQGSIILTTNKPFKQWASIFNNDSTFASAVLDRLLHHAETVPIQGKSYRMKDNIDET